MMDIEDLRNSRFEMHDEFGRIQVESRLFFCDGKTADAAAALAMSWRQWVVLANSKLIFQKLNAPDTNE